MHGWISFEATGENDNCSRNFKPPRKHTRAQMVEYMAYLFCRAFPPQGIPQPDPSGVGIGRGGLAGRLTTAHGSTRGEEDMKPCEANPRLSLVWEAGAQRLMKADLQCAFAYVSNGLQTRKTPRKLPGTKVLMEITLERYDEHVKHGRARQQQ